jgi:hypothetical protein
VKLTGIRPGDIVEVDKRGDTFYATAGRVGNGEVRFVPHSRRVTYQSATAREVVGHWRASKETRVAKGWA